MGKITPQILVTFLSVAKKQGATIHDQLYKQLKDALYKGMLRPGDRMPSSRELSIEFKISRNIVQQVFEQLTMEGFFEARTGAGTFISESVAKLHRPNNPPVQHQHVAANPYGLNNAFNGHISAVEPIVPFQQSVPLMKEFPFDAWARISAKVHRNMHLLHLGYDDAQGYLPLRKALADHLRISRSIICEPENIVIVNGTRQALHLAAEMLINKGDTCWMEDPGYAGATSALLRFGAKICPVPVNERGIDLHFAIEQYPRPKLAYVSPSHQFPMGTTMPLGERVKLLDYAKDNGVWIIEDDYDSEYRYSSRPIPALQGMDTNGNVIYSGTLSKVLLPALRLGYMVFPSKTLARQFATAKSVTDGQNNIITQAIAAEFISQGHFARHIRRMRLLYKKAQDDLVSLIDTHLCGKLTPVASEAGMHLVAWLPKGQSAEILAGEALKDGIILSPVSHYSPTGQHPNALIMGFAGFTFGEMEKAVLRLKQLL